MKKGLNLINVLIILVSIIIYLTITFIYKIDLGSGHKELENIVLLAIPCIIILLYTNTFDSVKKKNSISIYLLFYLLVTFGFVFSNNRSNILVNNGIMDRELNLIPFRSIMQLFNSTLGIRFAIYNILGNFLMLTPLSILLPLLNKKFRNIFNFSFCIICFCLFIEITQYFTKLGSFDIDDIILNFSGAVIVFLIINHSKLYNLLFKLFFELHIMKSVFYILYFILILLFIFLSTNRIILIRNYYYDNKVDYSNLQCFDNENTFIGEVSNYKYYSKCNYRNSYVIVGDRQYKILEFINSQYFNENMLDKLKLYREKIITNALLLKENNNKKVLFYKDNFSNYYLYGYDELWIEKDGNSYNTKIELEKDNLDISFIHSLVDLDKLKQNNGYSIEIGDYYNVLTCGSNYSEYNDFYILNKDYDISNNTCDILSNK